jgi:hypothetical protein
MHTKRTEQISRIESNLDTAYTAYTAYTARAHSHNHPTKNRILSPKYDFEFNFETRLLATWVGAWETCNVPTPALSKKASDSPVAPVEA